MIEIQFAEEVKGLIQSQFGQMLEPRRLKVLVVEDDMSLHPLWDHIVRAVNPQAIIRQAYTEEAAEKIIERQRQAGEDFDLIISDIFLDGDRNGVDLWKKYGKSQTLFLFTSVISKTDFVKMIGTEEKEYPLLLQKPVRAMKSIDVLQTLFNFRDFFTERKLRKGTKKGSFN